MSGPVRDFESTSDGDWLVENGDFALIAGVEAVSQGIRIRLGMFLGECYLNESVGVDYLGSILVKTPDALVIRGLLTEAISGTPDVTNTVGAQLEIDGQTREGSISYVVDTVYSESPLSGQVGVP